MQREHVYLLVGIGAAVGLAWLFYDTAAGPSKVRWLPSEQPNTGQLAAAELVAEEAASRGLGSVTVTSGTRSNHEQARIMLGNFEAKGSDPEYLRQLYRSNRALIDELIELPRTVDAWSQRLAEAAATGVYVSRHQWGRALDFRVRDLTTAARKKLWQAVKAAAAALGGRALDEGDHFHLQW